MDLFRRKSVLLILPGLVVIFYIAFSFMVGIKPTAGEEPTAGANGTGDEIDVTSVYYLPILRVAPTPTPTPLPPPIVTPVPGAPNLLANPSFEGDGNWTHPDGIPEIQEPNHWDLSWDEGENPLDSDPGNIFVRPESRHLSTQYLPGHEHDLFIWDGEWTLHIFKGYGAVSYRLNTEVHLMPGRYLFNIHIFPDLVDHYKNGQKVWAEDPLSGEVRLVVNGEETNWFLPEFGKKNTFQTIFEVNQEQQVDLTVAVRGRWAIQNNGWFMDDWSLTRMN